MLIKYHKKVHFDFIACVKYIFESIFCYFVVYSLCDLDVLDKSTYIHIIFFIMCITFPFIFTSNITPTLLLVLVFSEYKILYQSSISLTITLFHFLSCTEQMFTFILFKTSDNFLFLPVNIPTFYVLTLSLNLFCIFT